MDWDDMKLPPLEEVLGRVEGDSNNNGSSDGSGQVRSPWYNETCPIAKRRDGFGEIKIEKGKYINSIICEYFSRIHCGLTSGICGFLEHGR